MYSGVKDVWGLEDSVLHTTLETPPRLRVRPHFWVGGVKSFSLWLQALPFTKRVLRRHSLALGGGAWVHQGVGLVTRKRTQYGGMEQSRPHTEYPPRLNPETVGSRERVFTVKDQNSLLPSQGFLIHKHLITWNITKNSTGENLKERTIKI